MSVLHTADTQLPVDKNNPLPIQERGSDSLKAAVVNVTTAGSRVQLPNYPCRQVTLFIKWANKASIYVGGNDVSSTVYGVEMHGANDRVTLEVSNTNLLWIDASFSGDGLSYIAI